jgi:alpha-L-fucosidase 2
MGKKYQAKKQFFHYFMVLTLLMVMLPTVHLFARHGIMRKIDFRTYMSQHDLIWEEIPNQWNEGAFVGNGQVGMMIYANLTDNRLDFHMGRQDITDHRLAPGKKTSMGVAGAELYDYSRLDIGRMVLRPAGKILSMKLRQDLWNAEVRGVITTDAGEITFRAFTPYTRMLHVIELRSSEKKDGKTVNYLWEWKAGNPVSPRVFARSAKNYKINPKPVIKKVDGIDVCEQSLLAGGDYATAWKEVSGKDNLSVLYFSTSNEIPASQVSAQVAVKTVSDAASLSLSHLEKEHRNWWHNYFQKSFISIPDGRMESFFWIQMYKMACSSRTDGPALDLLGPFFKNTAWPGLWWNLNVQLTYWPFNISNHQDIAVSFIKLVDDYFDVMLAKYSGQKLGDFAWALHNYWLYYSYEGDDKSVQNKWVPKAMQIARAYEKMQIRNDKGKIELAPMGSPEFRGFQTFPNTNYNLAILRWLLNALIESNEKANANSEDVARWKQTLHDLTDYPQNENGLMIASNQPLNVSHRHYSHLLALYPLYQLNPDSPEDRDLLVKSVNHWHQIDEGKGLAGYSFTGAASLYAACGMGNEADIFLQKFMDGNVGRGMLLANTFYMEGNGRNPTVETPLSGAASVMELLIQSWRGKIRVFPAVPDDWKDASFDQLKAQGGFLVSASRSKGKTQWIKVKSLVGKPCIVKVPDWNSALSKDKIQKNMVTKIADGEFRVDLKAGQEIVLVPEFFTGKAVIEQIKHKESDKNSWGVKKGMSLKEIMEYQVPEYGK